MIHVFDPYERSFSLLIMDGLFSAFALKIKCQILNTIVYNVSFLDYKFAHICVACTRSFLFLIHTLHSLLLLYVICAFKSELCS